MSDTATPTKRAVKDSDLFTVKTSATAYLIVNEAGDTVGEVEKKGSRYYATANNVSVPGAPSLAKAVLAIEPSTAALPEYPADEAADVTMAPEVKEPKLTVVKDKPAKPADREPRIRVSGKLIPLLKADGEGSKKLLKRIKNGTAYTSGKFEGDVRIEMDAMERDVLAVMANNLLEGDALKGTDRGTSVAARALVKWLATVAAR